jgi:hypothetical protein
MYKARVLGVNIKEGMFVLVYAIMYITVGLIRTLVV